MSAPKYWRSLEELEDTPEFRRKLAQEFPDLSATWSGDMSRRRFLQLMGASLGLAFMAGCKKPLEKIIPYGEPPEELIPGKPLYFATALTQGRSTCGVLVESHEGRPTKVEGNPLHPDSLGGLDVFSQAEILNLYDPDRSQVVTRSGAISTWENFSSAWRLALQGLKSGAGLRILTGLVTSPTLARQLERVLAAYPEARWHQFEPAESDWVQEGTMLAFGRRLQPALRLEQADVVLALDSDFLYVGPGKLAYTRGFAVRRRAGESGRAMNRLYVAESTPSVTGSMADHRLSLRSAEIEPLARAVARELGVPNVPPGPLSEQALRWAHAVARDLRKNAGRGVVAAGDGQPPAVHALACAMNHALGAIGRAALYRVPPESRPESQLESLRSLTQDMEAGRVQALLVLGCNPVFSAPADFKFAKHFERVGLRIHMGLHPDETSARSQWHLPQAHALEAWSDALALDSTASIVQPLIAPLYQGKSFHELLSLLFDDAPASGYDLVRGYWRSGYGAGFDDFWGRSLNDGVIAKTARAPERVRLKPDFAIPPYKGTSDGWEVVFRPDPSVWDGRHANNGWLQELPKPHSTLTWDNAALLNPADARELGLSDGEMVELRFEGLNVQAPVLALPGQARKSVAVHLGYGRSEAGRVGKDAGFNAYSIRTARSPWGGAGLELAKIGGRRKLAVTQTHHNMENRDLVREATLGHFRAHPDFAQDEYKPPPQDSLYPRWEPGEYGWGMSVNLNSCIGCNACVIACQSENNSPVVGKEEVLRGREMHWIRVDRYFKGEPEEPEMLQQPVLCMHCEDAPCELVCPVGATVHSKEGLNEMVYNRCVGTRYCSNNCPYKVRRFNFFQFSDLKTESLKLMRNPNVTVRDRGVMEKCTYCVQRISVARIEAKKQNRKIKDGEVVTACQAACPAEAIVFGDVQDPTSQVSREKASPLNYGLLTELGTRPRTTYLARLRNPNPELEGAS